MAIIVSTSDPRALLLNIKSAIRDKTVSGWICDSDGDFTQASEQWKERAWLRPAIYGDKIIFTTFPPSNVTMSGTVYASYHAQFIQMLLRHFDTKFDEVSASALPKYGDVVRPNVKSSSSSG
jgi:hypothetical protein